MRRLYLVLLVILLIAIVGVTLYLHYQEKPASRQTAPIYHGGPCDDPAYYDSHLQACSVQ